MYAAAAVASLLLSATIAASAAPPAPAPDEIFARARAVTASCTTPPHLTYVIHVRVRENGIEKSRHYTAFYDRVREHVETKAISREEIDAEPRAGAKLFGGILTHGQTIKRALNAQVSDFIGVPILAPNYRFGLVPPARPSPTGTANLPDLEGPREIGHYVSTRRRYTVTLAGREAVGQRPAYHLALAPLREPERYRLRDLWVDQTSFDVLKLRTDGNFTGKETSAVPWTVTFRRDGEACYIDRELAEEPLVFSHARIYDDVSVTFEEITPANVPQITLLSGGTSLVELREPQ